MALKNKNDKKDEMNENKLGLTNFVKSFFLKLVP